CPCISRRHQRQHPSKIAGHKRDDRGDDLDSGFHVCLRFATGEIVLKKNSCIAHATAGLAVIVLLGFLAACTSKVGGDAMATVDGRKIFRTDVDKYYENTLASSQQSPAGEQATALRLNILRQMIDDEILMRRAEKLGLLATDDQVDSKVNEIKAPFTQEEFDKRMQDRKITVADH